MPTYPPNATFTPRLGLPRPGLDDIADGPDGFFDLTDVLDPIVAAYASGTTAARPAPGTSGRFYWNTDTKTLEFDNGTAWVKAGGSAVAGSALPILDVGMPGQIRAGRQLTVADFTALGLAPPIGLWNLSDLSNLGSDARALANKGAVPFGVGINGAAATRRRSSPGRHHKRCISRTRARPTRCASRRVRGAVGSARPSAEPSSTLSRR
jgi:hypothetical protein